MNTDTTATHEGAQEDTAEYGGATAITSSTRQWSDFDEGWSRFGDADANPARRDQAEWDLRPVIVEHTSPGGDHFGTNAVWIPVAVSDAELDAALARARDRYVEYKRVLRETAEHRAPSPQWSFHVLDDDDLSERFTPDDLMMTVGDFIALQRQRTEAYQQEQDRIRAARKGFVEILCEEIPGAKGTHDWRVRSAARVVWPDGDGLKSWLDLPDGDEVSDADPTAPAPPGRDEG